MAADDYPWLRESLTKAVRAICPGWMQGRRDDLVQTAMMTVLRLRRQGEEDRQFPASYLRKMAYTALVDEIRRVRSRREVSIETATEASPSLHQAGADPLRRAQGREISVAIRKCLQRLVEPRQVAVTLHLLGYTAPEISQRLGWKTKRASNLVYRGLYNLRECLAELGLTP